MNVIWLPRFLQKIEVIPTATAMTSTCWLSWCYNAAWCDWDDHEDTTLFDFSISVATSSLAWNVPSHWSQVVGRNFLSGMRSHLKHLWNSQTLNWATPRRERSHKNKAGKTTSTPQYLPSMIHQKLLCYILLYLLSFRKGSVFSTSCSQSNEFHPWIQRHVETCPGTGLHFAAKPLPVSSQQ